MSQTSRPVSVDDFRARTGRAFADVEAFPDAMVAFWLAEGAGFCPADRWGTLRAQGVTFWAAHKLALLAAAGRAADGTGGLDAAAGPVVSESKTVGAVSHSVSRAGAVSAGTADPNGGEYNATVWGQQFQALRRMVGIGVRQV